MDARQGYIHKKIGSTPEKNRELTLFLVGPTAVGKTEVGIKLAKLIDAEIISCDSMQVYKGMDIVSQKPTRLQQRQIRHHMVDIVSPAQNFNVANYRKRALEIIKALHKKGKIPLFVGGTALYMKALIDGLFPSPKPDFKLRQRLKSQAEKEGCLYNKLKEIDPDTAEMLHPNDERRIIRALEVYYKTHTPMSVLKKNTKGLSEDYDIKIFCLNRPREELYSRINKRVDRMFKQGIIAECKRLKNKKLSQNASQVLGCKEIFAYLEKKCTKSEAREVLKRNTRHFAKRQLSWFRNDPRIEWVNINNERNIKEIAKAISKKIYG